MHDYYNSPEAYQQYLQEEAEAKAYYDFDPGAAEPDYPYEDNFSPGEAELSDLYEEERWLAYQEEMSEQDGLYPSYEWHKEYDMLDEFEGIEHYFSHPYEEEFHDIPC